MLDAAVRLEVNHWNGAVEPRVVLREVYPLEVDPDALSPHPCECDEAEWWSRFESELTRDLTAQGSAVERSSPYAGLSLHGADGVERKLLIEPPRLHGTAVWRKTRS